MVTVIAVIGTVLLLGASIFLAIRFKSSRRGQVKKTSAVKFKAHGSTPRKPEQAETKWRAVKIKPGLICCDSAEKEAGKIYLAASAPIFPLDQCSEKECGCKYMHLQDRRDGDDRRESTEYLDDLLKLHEKERRHLVERRLAVS